MIEAGTTPVSMQYLRNLAHTTRRLGTQDAFIDVALQWAQQASDEIDRLTRVLQKRTEQIGVACDKHDLTHALACGHCLHEARAERDALAKDAERYRWLRGDACTDHSVRWAQWEVRCWRAPFWTSDLRREKLDAAIDAQIEKERSDA